MPTSAGSTGTRTSPSCASRAVPALLSAALIVTTPAPAIAGGASPSALSSVAVQQQATTVTIGVRQTADTYTFTGTISPAVAGVQVTVARLDTDGRVTGIASTRTAAGGRYEIRTSLPGGFASYYILTSATSQSKAGRSRLYGLIVNVRAGSATTPTISLDVRRGRSTYVFSGQLRPGRNVPVTLARRDGGRLVGVVGSRTSAGGQYSFSVAVRPGTHYFQVLTGAASGLTAVSSRVYGLVVTSASAARPTAVPPLHGGTAFAVYLAVSNDPADPRLQAAAASARRLGYATSTTTLGCDLASVRGLGRDTSSQQHATVLYFRTEAEARQFTSLHPSVEARVVRVQTFCME